MFILMLSSESFILHVLTLPYGMIILQMTKLAIIPFTVLLETIFLKKQFR